MFIKLMFLILLDRWTIDLPNEYSFDKKKPLILTKYYASWVLDWT